MDKVDIGAGQLIALILDLEGCRVGRPTRSPHPHHQSKLSSTAPASSQQKQFWCFGFLSLTLCWLGLWLPLNFRPSHPLLDLKPCVCNKPEMLSMGPETVRHSLPRKKKKRVSLNYFIYHRKQHQQKSSGETTFLWQKGVYNVLRISKSIHRSITYQNSHKEGKSLDFRWLF